jgi:translation initiation factor 2B subunit (eIF-2B alpha/beta/delta family)
MKSNELESLYQLFRDHETVMGTSRTTIVALQSIRDSIQRLRCLPDAFENLVLELNEVIKNTQPKIIPLVHLIEAFEAEMRPHFGKPLNEAKACALAILDQKLALYKSAVERLVDHGRRLIEDGDVIIAHSPSLVVRNALTSAHTDLQRKFRVIVLEQHFIRIKQLIRDLAAGGIEHMVIPEYNLSHFMEIANKLFLGAISVTPDRKVVTTVGSANIAGLCHLNGIPVYLLINSLKFAHQSVAGQKIFKADQKQDKENLIYTQTTFSHDMVDFDLIDHVITEDGEISVR